jgi:hypothetical protein
MDEKEGCNGQKGDNGFGAVVGRNGGNALTNSAPQSVMDKGDWLA